MSRVVSCVEETWHEVRALGFGFCLSMRLMAAHTRHLLSQKNPMAPRAPSAKQRNEASCMLNNIGSTASSCERMEHSQIYIMPPMVQVEEARD